MSLNTAHANNGVLIFNGEGILLYCDDVELHFEGADAKGFGGTKKGRIYLTTHRMIFTNKNGTDPLQSFSFPFFSMKNIELEQPIFGANYIKGRVQAQTGGNWTGEAIFKLKFMSGGAIEFGQAMLQAAKMASRHMPPQPPPYTPHQGPYYPAQPPAYTPPPGGYYGFVPPTHVFPNAPPANTVFTMNMPPPYPGIYPPPYSGAPQAGYPPQAGMPQQPPGYTPSPNYPNGGASAGPPPPPGFNPNVTQQQQNAAFASSDSARTKEQEAMASAYYNPYNPGSVYVPQANGYPQNYNCPPPPYSEASKKDQ